VSLLELAHRLAAAYLAGVADRPVSPRTSVDELRARLGAPLADDGLAPERVLAELAAGCDPGLVASAGPRYFGFVTGGSHPAALAADWLTSAWDQNACLLVASPASAVVEDIAAGWIRELIGLPAGAAVGFVTGGMMANFTCLAAARHRLYAGLGWDVEDRGLVGAPPIEVIVGEEAHATIGVALRYLGLGAGRVRRIAADGQGRMRADELAAALRATTAPALVCAQAGNVNTGAFDPFAEIAAETHARGGWLHVDGAFGLWAGAAPSLAHLTAGAAAADSWAVDGHKWLNVPYDCGFAIVRDPDDLRAAMHISAAYLTAGSLDRYDLVPESSRRARGFPVYAVLRALGRRGVGELVERCARLARRLAAGVDGQAGVQVLNEVVLNQVLLRFGDDDERTRAVLARVQHGGVAWMGATTWQGRAAMRVSVSSWATTEPDIDRTVAAILEAATATALS
jgi:glutamate/tyrosine decarboxylase-like PLP-dependent enzyme